MAVPDDNPLHHGPQRRAVPGMLIFLAALALIAIGIVVWYSLGN